MLLSFGLMFLLFCTKENLSPSSEIEYPNGDEGISKMITKGIEQNQNNYYVYEADSAVESETITLSNWL